MKEFMGLVRRNRQLFFKDKGMLLTSLITPIILIVLYGTFLANVYRDSFKNALPEFISISDELLNGTVACQLAAALLAVSCITVTFCVNLTMVQDKANNVRRDFLITPTKKSTLGLAYYASTFLNSFMVNILALALCLGYIKLNGWFLNGLDVVILVGDVALLVLFGTTISSLLCYPLKTQGQMSAVGTIVSAGYGFISGAYMPISNFSKGLQNVLSYLPSTYATSMIKNHLLRGVFVEMEHIGFPSEVVSSIAASLDCHPALNGTIITPFQMVMMVSGIVIVGTILYAVICNLDSKN